MDTEEIIKLALEGKTSEALELIKEGEVRDASEFHRFNAGGVSKACEAGGQAVALELLRRRIINEADVDDVAEDARHHLRRWLKDYIRNVIN